MSFTVHPPGERSKRDWVARTIVDHDRREHVLKGCKNEAEAKLRAAQIELGRIAALKAKPGTRSEITFKEAAYLYTKYHGIDLDAEPRTLSEQPRTRQRLIRKLNASDLGAMFVREIKVMDLENTAKALYPGRTNQTMNRNVMVPAAAILHYVSEHGDYCPWLRVKLFPEPEPETRSVTQAVEDKLLNAQLEPMQHLLLTWLFRHGRRITETLRLTWENIDLEAMDPNGNPRPTYSFKNTKHNGKQKVMPFHPEVLELLLAAVPEEDRHGKVWPWTCRTSVRNWLNPLTEKLGVDFTCHMARHTLGKKLNATKQGLKTIMDTLGHASAKSSLRYQSTDIDDVAGALEAASAHRKPQFRKAS